MSEPFGPMRPAAEVPRLLDCLDEVAQALTFHGTWTLLLDLDGTLAPLASHPDLACVPPETLECLRVLSTRKEGLVAIVTGRALDSARALIGLDCLYYAGNHGLEIEGPAGLRFVEPTAHGLQPVLSARGQALRERLQAIQGAWIEEKGLTSSVHYRAVDVEAWPGLAEHVTAIVPPEDPHFVVHAGKHVHELRPRVAWGKGKASRWLLERLERTASATFFLGDDVTDEDAFAELGATAITVRIGGFEQTRARFRAADTGEVRHFLEWLAQVPAASP